MILDEQLRWVSDKVYWVDKNRKDVQYYPEDGEKYFYDDEEHNLGQFQVLKVQDNNSDSDFINNNGMQAMAVAPVINGEVDTTQIIIAYAGTYSSDWNDLETDFKSVILGVNHSSEKVFYKGATREIPVKSQIDTALEFAAQIKSQYPDAKIETMGHLLGKRECKLIIKVKGYSERIGFFYLAML